MMLIPANHTVARNRSFINRLGIGELLWVTAWLLGLAALISYAIWRVIPGIERHILGNVQQSISPLVTSPVMVSVDGHQTTITGEAATDAEHDDLLAAVEQTPGVRKVVNRLTVARSAPTTTSTDQQPVPTSVTSTADTAVEDATVEDNDARELADGPDEDASAADIGALADATVESEEDAAAGDADRAAPTLTIRMEESALTLEGRLDPSVDVTSVIQPALAAFDPSYLTNRIQLSEPTADAPWLAPLTALLPAMSTLSDPAIEIADKQVTLSGTAATREQHDQLVDDALETLAEYSLIERIDVATPQVGAGISATAESNTPTRGSADAVSALFQAMNTLDSDDRRILFLPNSAEFADGSAQKLNTIATLFSEHVDTRIEIEGHTDTSGDADANMRLSQQRAIAVREALVDRGIERDRLVAYGYGEGIPLVDNGTPEGRALNRRIEFRIQPLEDQP